MFRVKVCGITSPRDAAMAAELGADAVGVNFYRGSRRCVSPGEAARIVRAVKDRLLVVGVFVNAGPSEILALCRELGIGTVQLSGDEQAAQSRSLPLRRIKSLRPAAGGRFEPGPAYPCDAFLLDALVPGEYGGTGTTVDWERAGAWIAGLRKGASAGIPCILAGGLDPGNVASAIRTVRPDGVDVASGVEADPRTKDPRKLEAFIRNALEGFAGAAA